MSMLVIYRMFHVVFLIIYLLMTPNESRNLPGDIDPKPGWQGLFAAPSCKREHRDSRGRVNAVERKCTLSN